VDLSFFSRPPGLWLATLGVATLLLGLGYEAAWQGLEPQLELAQRELAEQTTRANRLAAENQSLESRLSQAQARLEAGRPRSRDEDILAEGEEAAARLVRQGEAALLLDGQVTVQLEALLSGPRRAVLRVKVAGGQEATKVLAPGQDMEIRVNGRAWRLTLRRILASSMLFSLAQVKN
jgi:hypothetical protein